LNAAVRTEVIEEVVKVRTDFGGQITGQQLFVHAIEG
jgi:hypothetical protein